MDSTPISYGIQRVDHTVGNVPHMRQTLDYIKAFSGFHEFAEFTTEVSTGLLCGQLLGVPTLLLPTSASYMKSGKGWSRTQHAGKVDCLACLQQAQ